MFKLNITIYTDSHFLQKCFTHDKLMSTWMDEIYILLKDEVKFVDGIYIVKTTIKKRTLLTMLITN